MRTHESIMSGNKGTKLLLIIFFCFCISYGTASTSPQTVSKNENGSPLTPLHPSRTGGHPVKQLGTTPGDKFIIRPLFPFVLFQKEKLLIRTSHRRHRHKRRIRHEQRDEIRLEEIGQILSTPPPALNDELLSPEEKAEFKKEGNMRKIKGQKSLNFSSTSDASIPPSIDNLAAKSFQVLESNKESDLMSDKSAETSKNPITTKNTPNVTYSPPPWLKEGNVKSENSWESAKELSRESSKLGSKLEENRFPWNIGTNVFHSNYFENKVEPQRESQLTPLILSTNFSSKVNNRFPHFVSFNTSKSSLIPSKNNIGGKRVSTLSSTTNPQTKTTAHNFHHHGIGIFFNPSHLTKSSLALEKVENLLYFHQLDGAQGQSNVVDTSLHDNETEISDYDSVTVNDELNANNMSKGDDNEEVECFACDENSKRFDQSMGKDENDSWERSELIRIFKMRHPVELWEKAGLYNDAYLSVINSHWLKFEAASPIVHKVLGILYCFIMLIGCGGNLLVIIMFIRCRALRTPPNYLVVNLAISDFFMMAKMPIFIFNSFYQGPALGALGCQIYGFVGGLTGCGSILTLAAISLDRYYVIVYPLNPLKRTTSSRAFFMLACVWTYSAVFAAAPLFGVNAYVSEGFLTSCSFDYLSDKVLDKAFVCIFFVAAYVLPLTLIVFSYTNIFLIVRTAGKLEFYGSSGSAANLQRESFKCKRDQKKQKTELKIAVLSSVIFLCWTLAWTPYAVVALLGVFGFKEAITPLISAIPALFCKAASCIDPFMYAINHPRFQRELKNKFTICSKKAITSQVKRRASEDFYSSKTLDRSLEMTTSLRSKNVKGQTASPLKRKKHVTYSHKKATSSASSNNSRPGKYRGSEENTSSSEKGRRTSHATPNMSSSSNSREVGNNVLDEVLYNNLQNRYKICPTLACAKSKCNDQRIKEGINVKKDDGRQSCIDYCRKKQKIEKVDVICETEFGSEPGPDSHYFNRKYENEKGAFEDNESIEDYVILSNLPKPHSSSNEKEDSMSSANGMVKLEVNGDANKKLVKDKTISDKLETLIM